MIVFPNCKINIGLRITCKRPDGYHNIESIFYPVWLSDALEFVISDQAVGRDILNVTGIDTGSEPDNNLVIKAIIRLRERHRFPFLKIHLHKAIPNRCGTWRRIVRCGMRSEGDYKIFQAEYYRR